MIIGVIADLVFLQCSDRVFAFALLQGAGLFADDLERGLDAFAAEKVGDVQGRIVAGGQQIVLGVEPQDDVNPRLVGSGSRRQRHQHNQGDEKQAETREDRHGKPPVDGKKDAMIVPQRTIRDKRRSAS